MLVEVRVTFNTVKDHPFDGHFNNDGQQTNNEDNRGHWPPFRPVHVHLRWGDTHLSWTPHNSIPRRGWSLIFTWTRRSRCSCDKSLDHHGTEDCWIWQTFAKHPHFKNWGWLGGWIRDKLLVRNVWRVVYVSVLGIAGSRRGVEMKGSGSCFINKTPCLYLANQAVTVFSWEGLFCRKTCPQLEHCAKNERLFSSWKGLHSHLFSSK